MMKKWIHPVLLVLSWSTLATAQAKPALAPPPPTTVAGIPVHYEEATVGIYQLSDPLISDKGRKVTDAKSWRTERRPELVRLLETQQFGRAPGRPAEENFEVTDRGTSALSGTALRKQVTIRFSKDTSWPTIHLVEYLPAAAKKPVPMLLSIGFGAPQSAVNDAGITPVTVWNAKTQQRELPAVDHKMGAIEIEKFLAAGIGVATFYYGDVDPDFVAGFDKGIRAHYGSKERRADEWGAIAAWAWGLSRVEDYFESDKAVDAKRVALHGVSRLGKTVLWAGARDERFAAVIASCSGEGGAALSHRDYGETIAHLTAPTRFAYQFAPNYAQWAGFPDKAPFDAHFLIALIAPRPLLLQTGNSDFWSDPKGEFLAEVAAGPVYQLLGKEPLGTEIWPATNQPILHDLAYFMHEGGHGMVPGDWAVYLDFLKMHLHPER